MLHGEPTWSYLYRHVDRRRGRRPVCGRWRSTWSVSDAPTSPRRSPTTATPATSPGRREVVAALDLRDVVLLGQDWGGLIGLRLVAADPERYARRRRLEHRPADRRHRHAGRLVAVPHGRREGADPRRRPPRRVRLRARARRRRPRRVRRPVPRRDVTRRDRGRCRCSCRPARTTRRPSATAPPGRRWARYEKPFLVAFADSDPITAAMGPVLARSRPRRRRAAHPTITNAGHFLQEDAGAELGRVVGAFARAAYPH